MLVSETPTHATHELTHPRGELAQMTVIRPATAIVGAITTVIALIFFVQFLKLGNWQDLAQAVCYAVASIYTWMAFTWLYRDSHVILWITLFFATFGLSQIATSAFLENMGLPSAVVFVVFTLILSSSIKDENAATRSISYGILIAALCAILSLAPIPRVSYPLTAILSPILLGILFMVYVVLQTVHFVASTMRIRLVTVFVAIVVVPLSILSLVQSEYTFQVLRDQTNQQLSMAGLQTANGLEGFISQTRSQFTLASQFDIFYRYLHLHPSQRTGSPEAVELRKTLDALKITGTGNQLYVPSYALLDSYGTNVYDTSNSSGSQISSTNQDLSTLGFGSYEGEQSYFKIPFLTGEIYFSQFLITGNEKAFLFASAPIINPSGQIIGVLRLRFDGLILQQLVREYNGLVGPHSYAMLVDDNNIRIADGYTPQYLFKAVAPLSGSKVTDLQSSGRLPQGNATNFSTNFNEFDKILRNYQQEPYFMTEIPSYGSAQSQPEVGVIYHMRSMPWKVVYLIEDYDDSQVRRTQSSFVTLITTLVASIVGFIAIGAAQVLSRPISGLMKTAQSISDGDLEAQAPADTVDEFGMLGRAFNLMTRQMRLLIGGLEDRISSRTQEIEKQNQALTSRAAQLQTVSEVARQIVSMQEIETLLSSITHLISERFNYYHVGIFLLDETQEFAILRAANSEGGKRMLARNHMLPVGRLGIVGYVTGSGNARIVTDVGQDAVFFNNPDLPLTRSEMALPLKAGGHIIGALDIQSTESNAFHPEDIELFNILADQVAIALYNNQLYTETVRALNEAQTLHRQYLRNEWEQEMKARKVHGYVYNRAGVTVQDTELPIWKSVIATGQPQVELLPGVNGVVDKASLAMPITVRGETIGVIHVQDQGDQRNWSEDEMAVVNDVANQVAVALENARLFEATVRRAEREKKVLEITARIRSTNEPDRMMQIAINELQKALGATRTQIYVRKPVRASGAIPEVGEDNGDDTGIVDKNGQKGTDGEEAV